MTVIIYHKIIYIYICMCPNSCCETYLQHINNLFNTSLVGGGDWWSSAVLMACHWLL